MFIIGISLLLLTCYLVPCVPLALRVRSAFGWGVILRLLLGLACSVVILQVYWKITQNPLPDFSNLMKFYFFVGCSPLLEDLILRLSAVRRESPIVIMVSGLSFLLVGLVTRVILNALYPVVEL